MELHDHLYALGLRVGREVFDDPDGFRGALDDFLDEDAASTGDINLLVDTVRLGAYAAMTTMLDSGAEVSRAIEEAGARLARDRGSVDVAGAQWACAVLGFAVGRVSDPDVRRYRTHHPGPPPPGTAATVLPPTATPPQFPPPRQPGGLPAPQQSPAAYAPPATAVPPHVSPPHHPGSFPPPAGPGSWPRPTPKKRKPWPVLIAVVAVLAVVGGVAGAVIAGRGGDEPQVTPADSDGPDTSDTGGTSDSEPPEDDTSFESVNTRYTGLAALVTTGVDACESVPTVSGQSEQLECGFAAGTLTLATYTSMPELEAGRARAVTLDAGGVLQEAESGTLMGFEVEDADDNPTSAFLYWDDAAALQSAQYDATPGTDLDDLVTVFESTDPSVVYPDGPASTELTDFASQWFQTSKCERIETLVDNELEENFCDVNGPIVVYLGRFETFADLRAYRKSTLASAKDDGRELRTWNQQEGDPPEGDLYEYTTDSGSAVRYWDQPDCLCYAEAFLDNGSYVQLENWWITG